MIESTKDHRSDSDLPSNMMIESTKDQLIIFADRLGADDLAPPERFGRFNPYVKVFWDGEVRFFHRFFPFFPRFFVIFPPFFGQVALAEKRKRMAELSAAAEAVIQMGFEEAAVRKQQESLRQSTKVGAELVAELSELLKAAGTKF